MAYLSAAVALIGALGVFNLLLSLALIRRLRAGGGTMRRAPGPSLAVTLPKGQLVGDFTVTTAEGRVLSRESLKQLTLVGFFLPDCPPCRERLPEFLAYASRFPGDVVSVAVGDEAEAAGLAKRLAAVGEVVAEPVQGPMVGAFGVGGYPALCVVEPSGRIVATGSAIADLPTPVPA